MSNTRYEQNPFEALFRLQDDVNRVINQRGAPPREHVSSRVWSPAVDVYEDQEAIVVTAELPGMKQEDIDIELTGENLTIKGERRFEDEARRDRYVRMERQYGAFQRSFSIGVPIDENKVKAVYRNGVLEVTIPKAEATRPKKVQVSAE